MWVLHKDLLSWFNFVIACVIVTIYTCVTVGTEPPLYTTNWNKCFATEPYFKTRFDTVHSCILACQLRPKCMGVNFYRSTNVCELLNNVDLVNLTLNKPMTPCVSMHKSEMPEISSCPVCGENLACDLITNSCIGEECPRLGPMENGQIFGNMQVDKAKATLKCDSDFPLDPADEKLVCHAGNWSHSNPRCAPTTCTDTKDLVKELADDKISASTYYSFHYPHECRFDSSVYAWVPSELQNQYIQFDFGTRTIVMGLTTKGGHILYINKIWIRWVTQYKVSYSTDCSTPWIDYTDNFGPKVFDGNTDVDSPKTNMLSTPIIAQCIRVYPTDWHEFIAMHIALLGCDG